MAQQRSHKHGRKFARSGNHVKLDLSVQEVAGCLGVAAFDGVRQGVGTHTRLFGQVGAILQQEGHNS